MLWLAAAIVSSILTASNADVNRRFQQEGFRLNLWRTLLIAFFWSPLAFIMPWPTDWHFYAVAAFSGMAMILGNVVQSELSARHNGRVAILHVPLKALFVYIVWLVLDAEARTHLMAAPLVTLTVLGCFGVMVAALNVMRRNDASLAALKSIVPVVVAYGVADLLTRSVLPPDELAQRLVVFLFLITSVSAGVSLCMWPWRPKPELPFYSRRLLHAASWVAIVSAVNHVCFMIGLVLAPNPAYVSMVVMLAPVWLLVYHRWHGIRDDANPIAGTVMVAAAVVLVWVTF